MNASINSPESKCDAKAIKTSLCNSQYANFDDVCKDFMTFDLVGRVADCQVALALFHLAALKPFACFATLCAIHSLIEKDQKECFREVWQVVAPLLIYVPFSVLRGDGVNLLAEISQPTSQLQRLSQCQCV